MAPGLKVMDASHKVIKMVAGMNKSQHIQTKGVVLFQI